MFVLYIVILYSRYLNVFVCSSMLATVTVVAVLYIAPALS
jgi:hypothetical protein